jgi:hypothetical protein
MPMPQASACGAEEQEKMFGFLKALIGAVV